MGISTAAATNGTLSLRWWKCTTMSGNQYTALNIVKPLNCILQKGKLYAIRFISHS